MDVEAILKAATPMVLGLLACLKLYLDNRHLRLQRDAGIKGVNRYAKETGNGDRVKKLIAEEVAKAGVTKKFKKAVKDQA